VSLRVTDKNPGTGRLVDAVDCRIGQEVQGPVDRSAVRRPLRAEKNTQVILDSSAQIFEVARFGVARPGLRDTQLGSSVGQQEDEFLGWFMSLATSTKLDLLSIIGTKPDSNDVTTTRLCTSTESHSKRARVLVCSSFTSSWSVCPCNVG
jgi:hypothetical protein